MQRRNIGLVFCILGMLGGCTASLEDSILSSELDSDVPEFVIYEGVIRQVDEQVRIIRVAEAAFYTQENRQEIKAVEIEEYRDGVISLTAQADAMSVNGVTNNITISGNILFRIEDEGITISGDSFSWVDEDKELTSQSDKIVRIVTDDGSSVEGKGVKIRTDTQLVEFEDGASGVLVTGGE